MPSAATARSRCPAAEVTLPTIANVSNKPRVLLVTATLGRRPEYLKQTLESIRTQSVAADIIIVAPLDAPGIQETADNFAATLLPDPGSLPAAINLGIAHGLAVHEYAYVNWLNDDDLLEPGSLAATTETLDRNTNAVVAYGACRYIDEHGKQLFLSKAGPWASRILSWGPDLIPQPGMLVRSSAWMRLGGLDTSFRLAFDLDLLLRLKSLGLLLDTGTVVSSFRWHPGSLTVDDRRLNIKESEVAKRRNLSPAMRAVAWTWEPLVRLATSAAAHLVQRRARR